jgi:hypothetical protein
MRPLILIGILILGLGAFVLVRGGTFTTEREVASVGSLEITADEQQTIPAWLGGVAVVAGLVLIGVGAQKRA